MESNKPKKAVDAQTAQAILRKLILKNANAGKVVDVVFRFLKNEQVLIFKIQYNEPDIEVIDSVDQANLDTNEAKHE